MKVGYVRVSTIEQNEERQIVELRKNGVEKFFVDKVSAKALIAIYVFYFVINKAEICCFIIKGV